MRILQVLPRVPIPQNDGGAIAMYQLTEALRRRGHEVHWAALNTRKHFVQPNDLPTEWPVHTLAIDTEVRPLAALGAALFQRTPYPALRYLDERFSQLLTNLVRATPYDAILLETAFVLPYTWALRQATTGPLISRSHNIEHRIWHLHARAERQLLKKGYWHFLASQGKQWEVAASAETDAIAAISSSDASFFTAKLPGKPVVAVRPFVAPHPLPTRQPQPMRVGYLGALDWAPNLLGLRWFLDHVWPKVQARLPAAEFHLAGKRPRPDVLRWKAPGLVFHGEVADAASFWDSLALAVLPVTVGGGVRLKVLEALGRGIPMLTTPTGALGAEELVGDGFWVEATAEAWVQQVLALLQASQTQVQQAGEAAHQRVHTLFSEAETVAAFESLLAQCKG